MQSAADRRGAVAAYLRHHRGLASGRPQLLFGLPTLGRLVWRDCSAPGAVIAVVHVAERQPCALGRQTGREGDRIPAAFAPVDSDDDMLEHRDTALVDRPSAGAHTGLGS